MFFSRSFWARKAKWHIDFEKVANFYKSGKPILNNLRVVIGVDGVKN